MLKLKLFNGVAYWIKHTKHNKLLIINSVIKITC